MSQPDVSDVHVPGVVMPIGPYETFAACVADQRRKGSDLDEARRICGALERDMAKTSMRIVEKASTRRYTLGVVYQPGSPTDTDTQGDFASAETIERAAWDFMTRLQAMAKAGTTIVRAALDSDEGVIVKVALESDVEEGFAFEVEKGAGLDDMHLQVGDEQDLGIIVESYLAPADFTIGDEPIAKGTWLLGVRWSAGMWEKILKGERTGLSLYGLAELKEVAA